MASGFSGGSDFYTTTGYGAGGGGGSSMLTNAQQLQYRSSQSLSSQSGSSQISYDYLGSSQPLVPSSRRTDFLPKRSLSEQQQAAFLRSVKQRSQYNHTSPISPLTPFDFSSVNNYSGTPTTVYNPLLQQLRSLPINPNQTGVFNVPNNSFTATNRESDRDSVKNRLQELEKELLDDEEDTDVASSVVTNSEWSETMQNLMGQQPQANPFSPSPTSSCSSSSSPSPSTFPSTKQSFIDIANAISDGNLDVAVTNLEKLKMIGNPRGDPEQRLTNYLVSALKSKVSPAENVSTFPSAILSSSEHILGTQMLYGASPCFKLGFMAANLAILEAVKEQPNNNVHVIDFEIGQGSQYFTLIHALAERAFDAPIVFKITTVVDIDKENDMKIVGDSLRKLAERVGVFLKFNVLCKNVNELDREKLNCERDELLVVNFAFKLYKIPDESVSLENPRDELLRLVKGLAPRVVTLVEHEMNCNTAPFVARVGEVSSYYSALFNSLDSTMTRDGIERVKIEECLGRKAANSVACEGRDRVERCEVFGKWRARMGMAGFVSRPLGQHVAESMKTQLNSVYRNNPGFTVKEEAGGICFGWMGRVLTVASAWR